MNPIQMYELFVGNNYSYIEKKDGYWRRMYSPLTPYIIKQHLEHKIAIGSYPIYIKDTEVFCKWICIDIDSHIRISKKEREKIKEDHPDTWKIEIRKLKKEYKKKFDSKLKKKQYKFCCSLCNDLEKYFRTTEVILEDTGGGYHFWIFLVKLTSLETTGKYVEVIKPEFVKLYKEIVGDIEIPEFFPKQYGVAHLEKECGNGVRLPLGLNFDRNQKSKIIYGYLDRIKRVDVSSVAEEYEGDIKEIVIGTSCRPSEDRGFYERQRIRDDLDLWYFYPYIRPCFKRIMDGSTQCYNTHGHTMRMGLVHELVYHNVPQHLIPYAFENQQDFNLKTTQEQIDSILRSARGKVKYSCDTIKRLGYCQGYNMFECDYHKWKDLKC